MIAFFYTKSLVIYTAEDDKVVHVKDNIVLTQVHRERFEKAGLGARCVNKFAC